MGEEKTLFQKLKEALENHPIVAVLLASAFLLGALKPLKELVWPTQTQPPRSSLPPQEPPEPKVRLGAATPPCHYIVVPQLEAGTYGEMRVTAFDKSSDVFDGKKGAIVTLKNYDVGEVLELSVESMGVLRPVTIGSRKYRVRSKGQTWRGKFVLEEMRYMLVRLDELEEQSGAPVLSVTFLSDNQFVRELDRLGVLNEACDGRPIGVSFQIGSTGKKKDPAK